MNRFWYVFSVLLVIFIILQTLAVAQKQIVTQYNGWYMYFGNHRFGQWGLHTEYQWRRANWITNWQQSLLRLGVDYYADDKNILTAGYASIVTYPYGKQPVDVTFTEHRIWEQWITQHRAGRLYVNHRYRLEQRFLEMPAEDRYVFRQRIRYRLLLTLSLEDADLLNQSFFLAAYAEPFLGFGKGIGKNVLDQNRLYLALGYRFNPVSNIQVGYMNHYVIKSDGVRHERNHTLQVGLTLNTDWRLLL